MGPAAACSRMPCEPDERCENDACIPLLPDGSECTLSIECASNHCQNGLCCASGDCCSVPADCSEQYAGGAACDDVTAATTCQGMRLDAVCVSNVCGSVSAPDDSGCEGVEHACPNNRAPVICSNDADQDPPACPTSCSGNDGCLPGYVGGGSGACLLPVGTGASCQNSTQCQNGLVCDHQVCCASAPCCESNADCPSGLACDTAVSACHKTCVNFTTDRCSGNNTYCLNNACVAKKGNGTSCQNGNECTSGNCVEGVCCNSGCTSICQSCLNSATGAANGTCANISKGGNDTVGGACTAAGAGCGANVCACSAGACLSVLGQNCGNDAQCISGFCGGGKCVECKTNLHCAAGVCIAGKCQQQSGVGGPCDDSPDCAGNNVGCSGATCQCSGGYTNCDNVAANGCEVCGGCPQPCAEGAVCINNECLCRNDRSGGYGDVCYEPSRCSFNSQEQSYTGYCN